MTDLNLPNQHLPNFKRNNVQVVTLVGFGAIGQAIFARCVPRTGIRVSHIVVSPDRVAAWQERFGSTVRICSAVPPDASLVLECAGHRALHEHVLPALARGTESAILSIGALAEKNLPERLADAAKQGSTQLHLLAGAIGGIDAIAAARLAGLDSVTYSGRKPPNGWRGSAAQTLVDLDAIKEPVLILKASAREAAALYPKNANVAATVALAGLGLDQTEVQLFADPTITENIHELVMRGAFGEMTLTMKGRPLIENPKTSVLTVMAALRFLQNKAAAVTI